VINKTVNCFNPQVYSLKLLINKMGAKLELVYLMVDVVQKNLLRVHQVLQISFLSGLGVTVLMEFQNCVRNKYGKCDLPSNTISRIKDGLRKLHLDVEYSSFQVSDNIYWGRIWIDSIQIVCNGKGITPELAEASAYAELAERFSAGMFYPVFEERVRFNIPALYNEETDRFLNFEWMEGYVYMCMPTRMIWKKMF
jgi:hypothetical protein